MTIIIQGKKMVRAAHGQRKLVEVVTKKPDPTLGKAKRTGRAHVSTHTLHHWADKAFTDAPEVYSKDSFETHQAVDYAAPYERLVDVYHGWQSTRMDGGIVETDAYTEYTCLLMMARHIMRGSILMDHVEGFEIPYVRSRSAKYSPRTLLSAHAVNLAYKINQECDNPYTDSDEHSTNRPAPRFSEFYRKGQMGFAIGMLMRNGDGTAGAIALMNAMQRLDPDFVVDPVRCDASEPTSLTGMLQSHSAARRHRTCT